METPAGATPYDGVLVVTIKLKVTLPTFLGPLVEADERKLILQAMTGALRRFNNKYYATGKVRQGSDQKWDFTRCLIHFSPRYLVSNSVDATNATFAADIGTAHGSHFDIKGEMVDPPLSQWSGVTPVPANLAEVAAWEGTVPATLRADARLTTLKTALTDYHALDKADLAKRIEKVTAIIGENGAIAETVDLAGDWATASTGDARGVPEDGVDTALGSYAGATATDHAARITLVDSSARSLRRRRRWPEFPGEYTGDRIQESE